MTKLEIKHDVGEICGFGRTQFVASTVFLPERLRPGRPIVIFACPGGGYSRGYFDMHFDGRDGYSEAEYHTARGIIFVSIDHLGVGDSSTDRMDDLTVETIADANHALVQHVTGRLVAGALDAAFSAIEAPYVVGIGQSMGGGITMIMQGRHATYHAIAPLGISAVHTMLPQPSPEKFQAARDIFMFSRQTPLDQLAVSATGAHVPDFIYPFHWEDEPEDLRKADMEGGYPIRRTSPEFGSMTIPRCVVAMNSPGFFTPEVSKVKVPVLMAYGERDVSADMRREATAFMNSRDISIFIVPRMAHMHNFANTRALLWARVAGWAEMQSAAAS